MLDVEDDDNEFGNSDSLSRNGEHIVIGTCLVLCYSLPVVPNWYKCIIKCSTILSRTFDNEDWRGLEYVCVCVYILDLAGEKMV